MKIPTTSRGLFPPIICCRHPRIQASSSKNDTELPYPVLLRAVNDRNPQSPPEPSANHLRLRPHARMSAYASSICGCSASTSNSSLSVVALNSEPTTASEPHRTWMVQRSERHTEFDPFLPRMAAWTLSATPTFGEILRRGRGTWRLAVEMDNLLNSEVEPQRSR